MKYNFIDMVNFLKENNVNIRKVSFINYETSKPFNYGFYTDKKIFIALAEENTNDGTKDISNKIALEPIELFMGDIYVAEKLKYCTIILPYPQSIKEKNLLLKAIAFTKNRKNISFFDNFENKIENYEELSIKLNGE